MSPFLVCSWGLCNRWPSIRGPVNVRADCESFRGYTWRVYLKPRRRRTCSQGTGPLSARQGTRDIQRHPETWHRWTECNSLNREHHRTFEQHLNTCIWDSVKICADYVLGVHRMLAVAWNLLKKSLLGCSNCAGSLYACVCTICRSMAAGIMLAHHSCLRPIRTTSCVENLGGACFFGVQTHWLAKASVPLNCPWAGQDKLWSEVLSQGTCMTWWKTVPTGKTFYCKNAWRQVSHSPQKLL